MKNIFKILTVAIAACGALSMAACGGTVSNKIGTSPNWDARIVIKNDLSEGSEWFTHKEVATYSIAFEKGTNTAYSLDYITDGAKPASYTTKFYATEYNWASSSIPEEYRVSNTREYVYVYETEVKLSGTYTYGESTKDFDNHITTVAYFRSAQDNLQPVYSKQVIKCASPANFIPTSLEASYVEMDCVYETFYNVDCSKATVKCTDNLDSENSGVTESGIASTYSVFDSNSLDAALRSLTFSGTHVFDTFIAIEGKNFNYQASCAEAATLDTTKDDNAQIARALNAAVDSGYLFAGVNSEGNREYSYSAVTVSYVSNMPGSSSVYWYANVADTRLNSTRAALLKIINPVSFSLGTLTYSLSSLTTEAV
ncbi:MAG: hypothetical protein ACI4MH_00255 [Candidatus Coproplasma sp.]